MQDSSKDFLQETLKRQMMELMRVKESLISSNEDGSLAGDKASWCVQKISDVVNDLGHISDFLGQNFL